MFWGVAGVPKGRSFIFVEKSGDCGGATRDPTLSKTGRDWYEMR